MGIEKPEFDTFIINSKLLFNNLMNYVKQLQPSVVVLDCETDSPVEKTATLYGLGICFSDQKAFYIPFKNQDGSDVWNQSDRNYIASWLQHTFQELKVIGHNVVFDVLVLENNLGLYLDEHIYSDTILQKHALEEEPPHSLKDIAKKQLGEWADKAQEKLKESVIANGGKWKEDQKDMYLANMDILAEYCCWDVILTYLLFDIYEKRLEEENLLQLFYQDEIMPLYKEVTINMKRKGFPIDVEYYKQLKEELEDEIKTLESDIRRDIEDYIRDFEEELLDKNSPVKKSGNFPKEYAAEMGIPLPVSKKTEKITLSKAAVEKQKKAAPEYSEFYDFLLGEKDHKVLDKEIVHQIRTKLYLDKKSGDKATRWDKGDRHAFNLNSGDHLGHLMFDKLNFEAVKFSDKTGKPSTDADTIDYLIEKHSKDYPFLSKLLDYRKLGKLLSTYVIGILDRQIDGMIYTSMLQFGTTSGRFSSRNPNLQNQPRVKDEDSGLSELVLKYVNAIRKGFVAGKGRKVVNADYSALEPHCFAHMSGDEKLRDVFRKGYDLYSQVAIDVFKLEGYSADKKASNYLGKHKKEFRQKTKVFCLAVVYGAEEARIAEAMNCSWQEAQSIIKAYLKAYPNLKKYMNKCNFEATRNGMVKTDLGRIRHLPEAQTMFNLYGMKILDYKWAKKKKLLYERRKFKNMLNNAKNFPIQGLAAHIVNRAMIDVAREFKKQNINGWVALQVHDEITCIVSENDAAKGSEILQKCMENSIKLSIPLSAEPIVADNWSEAK